MHFNRWQKVAALVQARTGLSCATFKSYILVAGGLSEEHKKVTVMDSVEKYDTRYDQ